MRAWFISCAFGLGSLVACQSGPAPDAVATGSDLLMHNNFEQTAGWGPGSPSLTSEKAHSGHWSLRVDPTQPFSYTFARPLGELSPTPLRKMRLEAWALRTTAGSTARLVVQADASTTDETKVLYTNLELGPAVPTLDKWTKVSLPLTLPTSVSSSNILKIYLWNDRATDASYLDDVVLRRLD